MNTQGGMMYSPSSYLLSASHLLSWPFFFSLLSLLVLTQIWGHMAGPSPPLPATVGALDFYREISALSCLVDMRRTVLTHARRSQ